MTKSFKGVWIPKWGEMILIIVLFILGVVCSSLLAGILMNLGVGQDLLMLLTYPLMFLFVFIYFCIRNASSKVYRTELSVPVGRENRSLWLLVAILTFAASFVMDAVNEAMPPMPEWLMQALSSATGGNFIINFLSVAVLAPLLEEWLCRGLIIRTLYRNGVKAFWAIILSALFFALIHGNPWQAIPAFALGCLFGYVYYKTGNLWLCILMHFTNNFTSLMISQIEEVPDTATWFSIMPQGCYWVLFVVFILTLILGVSQISRFDVMNSQDISTPSQG